MMEKTCKCGRVWHEVRATDQACDSEKRASGELLLEIGSVDAVEFVIEAEVGAVHLHQDQVVHGHALAFENSFHAIHGASGFFFCAGRRLAVLIKADGAGDVEGVSHQHGIAEREGATCGGLIQHHVFAVESAAKDAMERSRRRKSPKMRCLMGTSVGEVALRWQVISLPIGVTAR